MSISGRPVVLVTGADLAQEALATLADCQVVFAGVRPSEDDLVRLVREHDPVGIIVRYGRITARVIDAGNALRVISKHGSGIDTIDVEHASRAGVDVRAAVGANAVAVAEHAVALMLACAKSVKVLDQSMQQDQWLKSSHKTLELNGRTLGLVGLGAIGRLVAQFGRAFGMRVIAYDPFLQNPPEGLTPVSIETLWRESDVVSLHCPLTSDNRHLVNAATLAQMKDGVILVNTARGGLIDESALVHAVREGKVRAAGIDSYEKEPPDPGHPFTGEPRIILTPHIAGVSQEAYVRMGVQAATNLLDSLAKGAQPV